MLSKRIDYLFFQRLGKRADAMRGLTLLCQERIGGWVLVAATRHERNVKVEWMYAGKSRKQFKRMGLAGMWTVFVNYCMGERV